MDLKLVRSKYNARREAKTSMSSLPVPNKSERDRSFDKPSHLPIGIAAIEIKALEAFLHREGIAHLNIAVWQERTQPPADVNPDQELLKTATDSGVPANFIIMSGNSNADKGRHHQRSSERVVAEAYMRILKHGMEKAVIERTVGTQESGAWRTIPLGCDIRQIKVQREFI